MEMACLYFILRIVLRIANSGVGDCWTILPEFWANNRPCVNTTKTTETAVFVVKIGLSKNAFMQKSRAFSSMEISLHAACVV